MEILRYPNVANAYGIPLLEGTVSTVGTNTVVTFKKYAYSDEWTGAFFVKIPTAITGNTNPVVFATEGVTGTVPLINYSGSAVTTTQFGTSGNGIRICFYDHASKRLQLLA